MHEGIFFLVLLIFSVIYIVLAISPARQIKSKKDYFLAGRNLGIFTATCALIATQLGAGLLLGTSQQAYNFGLYGFLFIFGISFGLIILSSGVAAKLRALNIATTTEIFETKYHSPNLRKFASILITVTLCGILIGNIIASRTLIESLGFKNQLFFTIFWLFIILYTMIGGLKAVVLTDVFQVLFIIFIFIGVFFYNLWHIKFNGFSLESLKILQQSFKTPHNWGQILKTLSMPALFALFEQDLAQVFFASHNKKIARWAAILTTIFVLIFGIIPIFFGIEAQLNNIHVIPGTSPLIQYLQTFLNDFTLILIAVGILAAIASTVDALLCAIGANITQDFDLSFLHLSEVIESKTAIFVVGIVLLGISFMMKPDIINILVESYGLPVSCLLIPLLFSYFLEKVSYTAGVTSVSLGFITYCIFFIIPTPIAKEVITLLVSCLGYFGGLIYEY